MMTKGSKFNGQEDQHGSENHEQTNTKFDAEKLQKNIEKT